MNEGGKETCRLYFIGKILCYKVWLFGRGSFERFFGRDKREELKTVN